MANAPSSEETNRDIVLRVRGGEIDAFGELVLRHELSVRAYLAARLDDVHEAEDLAQEVFVIAYRRLPDFDPSKPMGAWLRGIAHNVLRNSLRRRQGQPGSLEGFLEQAIESGAARWEERAEGSSIVAALEQCLGALAPHARELIKKRYAQGESVAALSRLMGVKHSALTMMLHRVRSGLRDCMEQRLAAAGG